MLSLAPTHHLTLLCAAQCEKAKDKAGRKPATVESLAVQTAVSETNGKGGMPSGGSADFYSIRLSGCLDNNEDKGKLYTPASTASKPGYFEVSRCPAASLPQQCARFECVKLRGGSSLWMRRT